MRYPPATIPWGRSCHLADDLGSIVTAAGSQSWSVIRLNYNLAMVTFSTRYYQYRADLSSGQTRNYNDRISAVAEKIITGTLVIGFTKTDASDLGSGSIIMEVDDREDRLNAGKTQFARVINLLPGLSAARCDDHKHNCSAGDGRISSAGTGSKAVTEDDIEFTYSREGRCATTPIAWVFVVRQILSTPVLQDDKRTVCSCRR